MPVSQAAPSPFAALLRRSKFASYDPAIGQVYTTHGGHAHRGQWGFKRPLPNRRRVGFITVRNIDSPEQQTEWNSAETSARWMRRWEELGKKLEVEEMGPWGLKGRFSWTIDSEFDRAGKVGLEPGRERAREQTVFNPLNILPNPDAMTPKQFQKYLDRLRSLRPEFKTYLEEYWKNEAKVNEQAGPAPKLGSEQRASSLKVTGSGQVDMYASAQGSSDLHVNNFLARRATRELHSIESRRIERRPHPFAGLEYTFMSALQSQHLHKPAPGRDIAQSRAERWQHSRIEEKADLIAVGGIIGKLCPDGTQNIMPTDFGTREQPRRDRARGKGMFRMSKVELHNAPLTVGRVPEAADRAALRSIEFRTIQAANAKRSNPHPPGSAEYVSWKDSQGQYGLAPIPVRLTQKVDHARQFLATRPKSQTEQTGLLGTLDVMISRTKRQ